MSWSKLEALDSEYRELYLDTIARSTTWYASLFVRPIAAETTATLTLASTSHHVC